MIFHYRFRDDQNVVKKGRVTADSEEVAKRRLELMSVKPIVMWEDSQPEPTLENVDHIGIEATPPDSFFKDQEALFKSQEEIINNENIGFKPVTSEGFDHAMHIPKNIITSKYTELADIVPTKEQVMTACPKRCQSLFFGEYDALKLLIDQHLSEGGKVVHLCMQPDVKGKLQLSIVIEHDKKGARQ